MSESNPGKRELTCHMIGGWSRILAIWKLSRANRVARNNQVDKCETGDTRNQPSKLGAITSEETFARDLATEMNHIAWEFAEEGRYRLALDVYDRAKSRGFKLSAPDAANCGLFLLCLERHEEALAHFREATAQAKEREGAYLENAGVAQWLMGRHRDAAITWRSRVSGISSGTIDYTDFSGGASDGLLLWYAAVTLKDDDLLNYAMDFFHELSTPERLSSFPGISSWPGPLVHLALGSKSAEAILQEHFGDKSLARLLRWDADILRRRKLVNALFFFAVKRRADGQERECRKLMSTVVQIENPLLELEWYLARGELS